MATRSRSSSFNRSRSSSFQGEAAVLPVYSVDATPMAPPPDYDSLFPSDQTANHFQPTAHYYTNTVTDQLAVQGIVDFSAPVPAPAMTFQHDIDTQQQQQQPPHYYSYQPKVHPAFTSRPNSGESTVRYHRRGTTEILQAASNYLTGYISSVTCGLLNSDSDDYSAVLPDQRPTLLTDINSKSEQAKTALPITPNILRRLHATLDLTSMEDTRFWAICLTGFYGLVRKSSLGVKKDTPTSCTLLRGNISMQGQHVSLGVPGGKHSEHPIYWHMAHGSDPRLCPWTAMRAWMYYWPRNTDRGAFELPTDNKNSYPTYDWLEARLRRALSDADIKGTYTIHSFRLGGAKCAESAGIPFALVQQLGGWTGGPGLRSRDSRLMAERFTEYVCRTSI